MFKVNDFSKKQDFEDLMEQEQQPRQSLTAQKPQNSAVRFEDPLRSSRKYG